MNQQNKYYALFSNKSGLPGVPVFMEGRFFKHQINGNPFSDENNIDYEWMQPGFNDFQLPEELYFYTKEKDINFDYYEFTNHFILSEQFINLLNDHKIPYLSSRLSIFDAKTKLKKETSKQYFFVKLDYQADVIDFERSVYRSLLSDDGEPIVYQGVKYVEFYEEIFLDPLQVQGEVFNIKDVILRTELFCTEKFRLAAIDAGIYGVIFVQISDYLDFVKNDGYLDSKYHESVDLKETSEGQETTAPDKNNTTSDIECRELSVEESTEILRLAALGRSRVSDNRNDDEPIIDLLAKYIDDLKSNRISTNELAFELGSLYGELIANQYGWGWVQIIGSGQTAYGVQSPDKRFACQVHNYIYLLLTTEKTNNLKLLFNMMADLSATPTQSGLTFLN